MQKQEVVKAYMLKEIQLLHSNDKIASRHALCHKFGFSRTTIDIAISDLVKEGVLYSKPGSGTFVSEAYRINARSIKKESDTWGVIIPDMTRDIYPLLIRGIEDYCRKININVVVCNTDHSITSQNIYATRLLESGVAGVILVPVIATEHDVSGLLALQEANIPIVFCNRYEETLSNISLVCSNDFYGGYIATKHLIEMGYKKIAYASYVKYKSSMDRYFGYVSALIENGYEIDQRIVLLDPTEKDDKQAEIRLYENAKQLIRSNDLIDAFFCHNDRVAVSIYKAIRALGKRVSSDIGLIGYDNSMLCEALETPLTSVHFQSYNIGWKCADILNSEIHGTVLQGNRVFVFQPELIVRQSCLGKKNEGIPYKIENAYASDVTV